MSFFQTSIYAAEGTLSDVTLTISQNGTGITDGGTLDPEQNIKVRVDFRVPVITDDPVPTNPIQHGDTVTIDISDAFKLNSIGTIPITTSDGTSLGHVTFQTDTNNMTKAVIVFDGDPTLFDGSDQTLTEVLGWFEAEFEYDDSESNGNTGNHTITILDKTYTVVVPDTTVYTVAKSGVVDLDNKWITWTVNVSGTQDGSPVDLAGRKFSDDLTDVGEYIDGSFTINSASVTPTYADHILGYTFPTGSTSPCVVTFKTAIDDSVLYAATDQTVANTASC